MKISNEVSVLWWSRTRVEKLFLSGELRKMLGKYSPVFPIQLSQGDLKFTMGSRLFYSRGEEYTSLWHLSRKSESEYPLSVLETSDRLGNSIQVWTCWGMKMAFKGRIGLLFALFRVMSIGLLTSFRLDCHREVWISHTKVKTLYLGVTNSMLPCGNGVKRTEGKIYPKDSTDISGWKEPNVPFKLPTR